MGPGIWHDGFDASRAESSGLPVTSVLFDAHQLGKRQTGNETYVRELLRGLTAIGGASIYAAVERRPVPLDVLGPEVRLLRVPTSGLGRLAALSFLARRLRPDVVHAIYFLPPVTGRPTVLTLHDISFERFPEFFSRSALLRDRVLVRLSALAATRIVTVSETSRRDVIELYRISPERVVAIPNGVSTAFYPPEDTDGPDQASREGRPLRLLAVGTLQPRKNLLRLLDAVRLISRETLVDLRIVGPDGYQAEAIRQRVAGSAQVTIVGYVTEEDLANEYRQADIFVYPSIYEGFGLPVLEAMACATPVVTSTGGSLPDVAGDAALMVDPFDVTAMAEAIRRIAEDSALARTLRDRGLERARMFSWEETARRHLEVYRELA
jgi:glycosyltransferase involved in cell wall biosynthesis